jgi:ABC-type dipeptide/oligopeptide/nickel transport system ATPase component
LIADEPTSSVDPSIQSSILQTLRELQHDLGTAMLIITHDPAILAGVAQRVLILYRGKVVEQGTVSQVFAHPKDPYTQQLITLIPRTMRART